MRNLGTENLFGRPRLLIQFVTKAKVMIQSGNILIKVKKENIQISLALCMKDCKLEIRPGTEGLGGTGGGF